MSGSRIKVYPGYGGNGNRIPHQEARYTCVVFPFTELSPTISGETSAVFRQCEGLFERLSSPHQRDVVLALLCAKFGVVERSPMQ